MSTVFLQKINFFSEKLRPVFSTGRKALQLLSFWNQKKR